MIWICHLSQPLWQVCWFLSQLPPLLMSRFGKLSDETRPTLSTRFSRSVEKKFESLKNFYARIFSFGLRHKTMVLITAIALLIGSFALFPMGLIGFAFMPEVDQGEFSVTLDMNQQVTIYRFSECCPLPWLRAMALNWKTVWLGCLSAAWQVLWYWLCSSYRWCIIVWTG